MHQDQQSKRENLAGTEAISKLKTLAEDAGVCMFTTNISKFPHQSRPMSLQQVDDDGNLWFISSSDSNKNAEVSVDNNVTLYFQNKGKYEFLVVNGEAEVYLDKETIERHWTEFANVWIDGKIISFIKMSFSAITGNKGLDGGVSGKITV